MLIKARTEFASALNQVCNEHGIEPTVVIDSIKEALLAAYRRDFGIAEEEDNFEAEVNNETGESKIYAKGKGKRPKKEVTPPGFGRIAAQVAKQILIQKIREAEKKAILGEYSKRMGTIVNGMVLRFDGSNVIVDVGKTEAVMPPQERIPSESYNINQRLTFFLKEIQEGYRGQQIVVSRSDNGLVESLFKREVPEVSSGAVEIRAIAREPGNRSKVAVFSRQSGVDPVGSCVGQKGVRVQAVINELGGEKIDIIQFSDDPARFVSAALSPAEKVEVTVKIDAKTAIAVVADAELSLAIGKDGQNARLAAKLTGFRIDIKSKTAILPKSKIKSPKPALITDKKP